MEEVLAKINRLKRDRGVGYSSNQTAILSPFVNGDAEIVAFDFHFWRQSPKTFSKAEIEAGRIELGVWQQGKDGGKEFWDEEAGIINDTVIDMSKVQTLFDNEVGFAFVSTAGFNYTTKGFVVFNAYQAGTHSLSVQGNSMAVNIPDTGIYVGFPTALVSNLPKKEELTEGDVVEMFRCEWEHVSAIDPKYLPCPVVIDLYELGVTEKIQDLMGTNGGLTTMTIDPEKLWNKVRNAPQIICSFPFEERRNSDGKMNVYLSGWYSVPATRMDHIELGYDAVSVTFTFVAKNSLARVTLALNIFDVSLRADETGHLIYPNTTTVLLDLYPLTPAPGNY